MRPERSRSSGDIIYPICATCGELIRTDQPLVDVPASTASFWRHRQIDTRVPGILQGSPSETFGLKVKSDDVLVQVKKTKGTLTVAILKSIQPK